MRPPVSCARVNTRKTIVLIHGAWHGAWCWQRLTPLLTDAGVRVITPDLSPADAEDAADGAAPLDSWARTVADIAAAEPGCRLVGHSRGGAVISRAAELEPDAIGLLVYLCAYLVPAGRSVAGIARADAGSLISPNLVPVKRGITCIVREEALRDTFYGDCSEEDFAWARARLVPEPLKALAAPLQVSTARFGRLPRAYIETTRDRAVSLDAQRRMQAELPCSPVFTLDSGHSPFLSQPEALARILISI